jgi:hypothetical protein
MSFIYSDAKQDFTTPVDFRAMNATAAYLRHYDNTLTLKFFHLNGTRVEKVQADKELAIAERKMRFWEFARNQKDPANNFDGDAAKIAIAKMDKNWNR